VKKLKGILKNLQGQKNDRGQWAGHSWARLSGWVLVKNCTNGLVVPFVSTVFRFHCYNDIFAFNLEKVTSVESNYPFLFCHLHYLGLKS